MFDDDFFIGIILFISLCLAIYFTNLSDQQKKVEIIKQVKDYSTYDNCYYLDKKYYCYNNENN